MKRCQYRFQLFYFRVEVGLKRTCKRLFADTNFLSMSNNRIIISNCLFHFVILSILPRSLLAVFVCVQTEKGGSEKRTSRAKASLLFWLTI